MRKVILSFLLAIAGLAAPPDPKREPAVVRAPVWTNGEVTAKVDGESAKVLRVLGGQSGLMILLVLDLAGDLSLVDPARATLVEQIEKLPPNALAGLLRAQDGLRVLADPGPDRTALTARIRELNISGRAGLLDTVEQAVELGDSILAKARVRLAVLYITDSVIGNYREDYTNPVVNSSDSADLSRRFPEGLVKEKIHQLTAQVSRRQSPLFIVHLNHRTDRLNEAYQTGLLELAAATGGSAEFCRSVAEIPAAIGKVFESILSHRAVDVEIRLGKMRQVALEVAAGDSVRARRFEIR